MRTRILEGEELRGLAEIPGPFHGRLDVIAQLGNAQVLVVEGEGEMAGAIVAYWPIFVAVHLEPLWVAPAARRNSVVAKLLVDGMRAQLAAERITTAFAVIAHEDLPTHLAMASRLGFQRMPGDLFFLTAEGDGKGVPSGSSSSSGDLARRSVLHEPGKEPADQLRAHVGDDGPPRLGE